MAKSVSRGSVRSTGIVPTTSTATVVAPAAAAVAPPVTPPPSGAAASAAGTSAVATGFRLEVQQLLAGVQSVLPPGTSLVTINGPLTQASMLADLLVMAQAYQNLDDRLVAVQQERQQLEAQLPTFKAQCAVFKAAIAGFFAGSPLLARFGIKSRGKPRNLSAMENVAKAVKAAGTRALRGTIGPKKKAALKFTGPVVVSAGPAVPAASPAASTSAPAAVPAADATPAAGAAPVVPGGSGKTS